MTQTLPVVEVASDGVEFGAAWWKTMLCSALPADAGPRGLIYAGAHVGEHVPLFSAGGFKPILAIEPNPVAFAQLRQVAPRFEGVQCVNVAVGDHDGTTPYFAVSDVPTLNSTLEPDRDYWLKVAGPELVDRHPVQRSEVPAARLDTLLAGKAEAYNTLYINTQGSELKVLQGARQILPHIEAIFTEVNFVRRYDGCATFDEVDAYLKAAGFGLIYLWRYQDGRYTHGEAIYSRAAAQAFKEYA